MQKTGYQYPKNSVKKSKSPNFKKVWGTEACKEKLVDFAALDVVPCLPQMEWETYLIQVELEAPFQIWDKKLMN